MNSPEREEVELCDHGVPLGDSIRIGCQLCWDSALDGAMRQAESGIAAHIEAGAPFETCKCAVCDALRERRIQSGMGHLEREEVAKELESELPVIEYEPGTWVDEVSGNIISARVRDALISERLRVRELTKALRYIHDTFDKDLQQGFRTNDKAFARDIAGSALNPKT